MANFLRRLLTQNTSIKLLMLGLFSTVAVLFIINITPLKASASTVTIYESGYSGNLQFGSGAWTGIAHSFGNCGGPGNFPGNSIPMTCTGTRFGPPDGVSLNYNGAIGGSGGGTPSCGTGCTSAQFNGMSLNSGNNTDGAAQCSFWSCDFNFTNGDPYVYANFIGAYCQSPQYVGSPGNCTLAPPQLTGCSYNIGAFASYTGSASDPWNQNGYTYTVADFNLSGSFNVGDREAENPVDYIWSTTPGGGTSSGCGARDPSGRFGFIDTRPGTGAPYNVSAGGNIEPVGARLGMPGYVNAGNGAGVWRTNVPCLAVAPNYDSAYKATCGGTPSLDYYAAFVDDGGRTSIGNVNGALTTIWCTGVDNNMSTKNPTSPNPSNYGMQGCGMINNPSQGAGFMFEGDDNPLGINTGWYTAGGHASNPGLYDYTTTIGSGGVPGVYGGALNPFYLIQEATSTWTNGISNETVLTFKYPIDNMPSITGNRSCSLRNATYTVNDPDGNSATTTAYTIVDSSTGATVGSGTLSGGNGTINMSGYDQTKSYVITLSTTGTTAAGFAGGNNPHFNPVSTTIVYSLDGSSTSTACQTNHPPTANISAYCSSSGINVTGVSDQDYPSSSLEVIIKDNGTQIADQIASGGSVHLNWPDNDFNTHIFTATAKGVNYNGVPDGVDYTATAPTAQCRYFNATPISQTPNLSPDSEAPTSASVTGWSVKVVIYNAPTNPPGVSISENANLYYIHASTQTNCTPPGFTGSQSYTSNSNNPFSPQSCSLPSTLTAGDQVCDTVSASPSNGFIDDNGNILASFPGMPTTLPPGASSSPAPPSTACVILANTPYLRVYGGDVQAGASFSSGNTCSATNPAAKIEAWNKEASGNYAGAAVQYAAFALNVITDFSTAGIAQSGNPSPPGALAFANTPPYLSLPSNFGGNFNFASCAADYAGIINTRVSAGLVVPGINFTQGPGTYTVNVGEPVHYVKGDAIISGNVVYANSTTGWAAIANIPSYYLIVEGNIYIDPSVRQLDGVYIAAPDPAVPNSGRIYTCATGTSPVSTSLLFTTCGNQLVINGAFIAQRVEFMRTNGRLHDSIANEPNTSAVPAEIFNFGPELYLIPPPAGTSSAGSYDYITSLPPIL